MFCYSCGASMPDDARFCGSCGAAASQPAGRAAATESPQGAYPAGQQPPGVSVQSPYAGGEVVYLETASFGARLGAWLLDSLFANVLGFIAGIAVAAVLALIVTAGQGDANTAFEQRQQDDDIEAAAMIGAYIGFLPVYFGYLWAGTALGGAWGKRIVGLRIVNVTSSAAPGWGSGALRVFVSIFSGILFIGYLWSLWDTERRTWHDRAAGTTVVYKR